MSASNASRPPRVLLFTIGSIGDTVMSIPAILSLREFFGHEASFTLLIDRQQGPVASAAEVVKALEFEVGTIEYPFTRRLAGRLRTPFALCLSLRRQRFDAAVYLAPSERSGGRVWRDRLFFRACHINKLYGFCAFGREQLRPLDEEGRPAAVASEAWWRLERLRLDGIPCDPAAALAPPFLVPQREERQKIAAWLAERRKIPQLPLVAIAPGAKQPANLWPLERFIEVGQRLIQRQACEPVVIGGPSEKAMGERCLSAWGTGINAAGAFTVAESLALIHQCAFLVGLDTGTTHLAAAAGVPCVAIYSDKDNPGRWSPLGEGHVTLRHRVPCGGCRLIHAPCPFPGHPCIEHITVGEVTAACQRRLQELSQNTDPDERMPTSQP